MSSFKFNLESSLTKDGTETTFPPIAFTDGSINFDASKEVSVAAGATDQQISFDGITAKHLIAEFSATVSVKVNSSGNTAQSLTPSADNPAVLVIIGGAVTTLFVSNPGGAAVHCQLFIASQA